MGLAPRASTMEATGRLADRVLFATGGFFVVAGGGAVSTGVSSGASTGSGATAGRTSLPASGGTVRLARIPPTPYSARRISSAVTTAIREGMALFLAAAPLVTAGGPNAGITSSLASTFMPSDDTETPERLTGPYPVVRGNSPGSFEHSSMSA